MTGDVSAGATALDIDPQAAQRRWTVLLRVLLMIPQIVVLWFVGIAASVVMFIGWWAALFTGRLPEWAREFLSGYLGWTARVYTYGGLLVDHYPPFGFNGEGYPVRVVLPAPTGLNRLAVLFRFILAIPAIVVNQVASYGWVLVSFFAWLVVLFTGRVPEPLFGATAAVLRYQVRLQAYFMMLTPVYPGRLFGDASEDPVPPTSATNPLLLSRNGRVLLIVMVVLGVLGLLAETANTVNSVNQIENHGYQYTYAPR
jgi:hypothetical protein